MTIGWEDKLMGVYRKDNVFFIDYYVNGRRRREKIGTSRKLAETVLAKRKVDIAEGKFLDIRTSKKIKFEIFADEFLNLHSKVNKKSWKSDLYNLHSLGKYFDGKYLYEISVKDIEGYKSDRIKSAAPATVNRELATLKTMLNKAVLWGKLKESPARPVSFLREPNGRMRFLEREEIVKVLSHCDKKLRPILVLALNTGMRRGEIFGLKWHDIDVKRNIITLLDTKNGEKREVYMNEQVKTALIRVPRNPKSAYIFCNLTANLIGIFAKASGQPCVNLV